MDKIFIHENGSIIAFNRMLNCSVVKNHGYYGPILMRGEKRGLVHF